MSPPRSLQVTSRPHLNQAGSSNSSLVGARDSSSVDHEAFNHRRSSRHSGDYDVMMVEAEELLLELQSVTDQARKAQRTQNTQARFLSDARALLFAEADVCHDLDEELHTREEEHANLMQNIEDMNEDLKREQKNIETEEKDAKGLKEEFTEHAKKCQVLAAKQNQLQAKLEAIESSHLRGDKQSWKRTALRAKVTRAQDDILILQSRVYDLRDKRAVSHGRTKALRHELQEAEMSLRREDAESSAVAERLDLAVNRVHTAENRLDNLSSELRMFRKGSKEDLQLELDRRRQAAEEAQRSYKEALARLETVKRRIEPVEAAFEAARSEGGNSEKNEEERREARVMAQVALSRTEVSAAEDEAHALRGEIANARQRQQEAAEQEEAVARAKEEVEERVVRQKAEAEERVVQAQAEAEALEEARAKAQDEVGVKETVLEFQIMLREREQAHRESLAGECEARHQRELRLLAAALHKLGIRYGRVLCNSESLAAEEASQGEP